MGMHTEVKVIVDDSDNVFVASCTQSLDLKVKSPFQSKFGGVQDQFGYEVISGSKEISNG